MYFTRALKKAWHSEVTEKFKKKLQDEEKKTVFSDEEMERKQDQMLEDCKIGWMFRDLYINTAGNTGVVDPKSVQIDTSSKPK